jgi:DNA-binding SARP family transcriptional activator
MSILRFELLRPLRGWYGEHELSLGPARQQTLVAVLAFHPGRELTPYQLLQSTWDADAPRSGSKVIAPYIYRIRQLLPCPALLRRGRLGYSLQLDPEQLDVTRLDRTLDAARSAEDPAIAVQHFDEALALFDDEPLAGLPGRWVAAMQRRFAEIRRTAICDRADVYLRLGQYDRAVAELVGVLEDHPCDERYAELLMRAQFHSGRQAAALDVYRRTRETLREQLGLEPGPALRSTLTAVLTHNC